MDEYISKKEAIIAVTRDGCTANVVGVLYHLPPADVVPKSEVVLASSDAVKMLIECHGYALTHDADIKKEVAREIFEEINEDCFDQFGYFEYEAYAELKKKYTEDKE